MSRRNGDRAKFHINRKRKLQHRRRIRELLATVAERRPNPEAAEQNDSAAKPRQE